VNTTKITTTITTDGAPTQTCRPLRPDSVYVQWSLRLAARPAPVPGPETQELAPAAAESSGWPAPATILLHVAQVYGLFLRGSGAKRRDPYTVEAKRTAIHLLSASGLGPMAIGRVMGLDHSTVHHHLRHVELDADQRRLLVDLEGELRRLASGASGA